MFVSHRAFMSQNYWAFFIWLNTLPGVPSHTLNLFSRKNVYRNFNLYRAVFNDAFQGKAAGMLQLNISLISLIVSLTLSLVRCL